MGTLARCVHGAARRGTPCDRLQAGCAPQSRRRGAVRRRHHRKARGLGRPLRDRPRHSLGRHRDRHQGPGGVRSARGRCAADGASRIGEAGADGQASTHQGLRGSALWRSRARGTALGSGLPRYRSAARLLSDARQRRGQSPVPARLPVRGGRDIAVLADGGIERRLRGIRRRMDAHRCPGLFEDARPDRGVLPACGSGPIVSGMRTVVVDKIASVTQACGLSHELRIAADIPCEEGLVVVVEILNNKSTYNTLELTSGRMAKVARGDVVVGALGHRKALFGYSGHIPATLKPGDVVQMLNIGGVLGICDSATPDKGKPFDCKVLGAVLTFPYLGERIGVPAKVGYKALDYEAPLNARGVPVVALAGTCMEAGKTAAASAIIARMRHRGLTVDAFKATGVSLRRDILAFEDSGARRTMIFSDCDHHREMRSGADAQHAHWNGGRSTGRYRVRIGRRFVGDVWRGIDPA